jgi:riboflavin biosynthesis pyrimidine reductase
MTPREVASADDVLALARTLLGASFVPPRGVVQTCAVDRADHVIRIGHAAPKSAHDFFLLHLARASADVIVTTGQILRDEPTLRYDLEGEGALPAALHAYRAKHATKPPRAKVVVLSRGDVSLDHPALAGWAEPVIATASATLARDASARGIRVLTHEGDSASLVRALRAVHATVSVEAGPNASGALYKGASRDVDSLYLSRFHGELSETARGASFLGRDALEARFRERSKAHEVSEPSGLWSFVRYAR